MICEQVLGIYTPRFLLLLLFVTVKLAKPRAFIFMASRLQRQYF